MANSAGRESEADTAESAVDLLIQLLKLSSLISGPMDDGVAAPNGIAINELRIIMCLGGEGALAGHEISELMAIPPMNVSRALASLLDRGWLEPVADPANRRRKPVRLSGAGWKAYRAMTPDVRGVADALLSDLRKTERDVLARATAKILARLEDWHVAHHPHG